MTGRRSRAICGPAHRADPGWRTCLGSSRPLGHPRGRIRPRTPNTGSAAPSRRRRAGRRTTARRGAASGGAPARAASPTSSRNRSSRWSRISVTVIDSMREAASSMASGMPSRRRQISATTSAASTNEMAGATADGALDEQRRGAVDAATSSDGTGQSCSSASRRPSRLVARTFTVSTGRGSPRSCRRPRPGRVRSCRTPAVATGPPALRRCCRRGSSPAVG